MTDTTGTALLLLFFAAMILALVALVLFVNWNRKRHAERQSALSLTQGMFQARVFPCPKCRQTINTSAQQCPFCSAPIDTTTAEASADLTQRVNRAIGEAADLKGAIAPEGMGEIALFGLLGSLMLRLWYFAVTRPVMAIRWWARYGSIQSDDADYIRARKDVAHTAKASAITLLVLLLFFVAAVASSSH